MTVKELRALAIKIAGELVESDAIESGDWIYAADVIESHLIEYCEDFNH